MSRQQAERLDAEDPLAGFRQRFYFGEPPVIYMDANSLGRMPLQAKTRVEQLLTNEWGDRLVEAWHDWIDLPARLGTKIAPMIGARDGEVIVGDSTSVNLYKLGMAACDSRRTRSRILTDEGNFPSDLYVLQAIASQRGLELLTVPEPSDAVGAIDDSVALVSFSHVNYKTGQRFDMEAITAEAHRHGALMLWDLCHSVGAMPIDLSGCAVDMAVGCTYKYLNGGPGAPSFLYVNERHHRSLRQPIWGWFGQKDQFAMSKEYLPADGIASWLVGTPPVISMAAMEAGLDITIEAGLDAIRRKSETITDALIGWADEMLVGLGIELATPRDPARRGSHVALRHPDAFRISQALIAQGVLPDFREPDVIRLGLSPVYTSYAETFSAIEHLANTLSDRGYLDLPIQRTRVT